MSTDYAFEEWDEEANAPRQTRGWRHASVLDRAPDGRGDFHPALEYQ